MNTQPTPRILVVDDEAPVREMLLQYLATHGIHADSAQSGAQAQAAVESKNYDLVLLDLGLPDMDGADLARQWHAHPSMAIICITGRSEEADKVMGLELGADDYVTKPFSLRELLARIRAVLRRKSPAAQTPVIRGRHPRAYHFAGWSLNLNTRRLQAPDGQAVSLTNIEFNLLAVFLGAPRSVISREQLLSNTRAFDDIYDRAIDVQILRLRRKLEADPKKPTLLRTERGAGYFLDADVETLWG